MGTLSLRESLAQGHTASHDRVTSPSRAAVRIHRLQAARRQSQAPGGEVVFHAEPHPRWRKPPVAGRVLSGGMALTDNGYNDRRPTLPSTSRGPGFRRETQSILAAARHPHLRTGKPRHGAVTALSESSRVISESLGTRVRAAHSGTFALSSGKDSCRQGSRRNGPALQT